MSQSSCSSERNLRGMTDASLCTDSNHLNELVSWSHHVPRFGQPDDDDGSGSIHQALLETPTPISPNGYFFHVWTWARHIMHFFENCPPSMAPYVFDQRQNFLHSRVDVRFLGPRPGGSKTVLLSLWSKTHYALADARTSIEALYAKLTFP
jgi:hypothetical protein